MTSGHETKQFWRGRFGDEYHKRNRVDWRKRIPFWKEIIEFTGARSVFEFGCGPGWNLSAIQRVDPLINVYGEEINDIAKYQGRNAGLLIGEDNISLIELVFTAGVLIHISPEELSEKMKGLADLSSDYVLAIEYEDEQEVEVEYRGHSGKLWRRPYGKLYQDMGLKMVMESGPQPEFDNAHVWLLRK